MGINDAAEQLKVAIQECIRLERALAAANATITRLSPDPARRWFDTLGHPIALERDLTEARATISEQAKMIKAALEYIEDEKRLGADEQSLWVDAEELRQRLSADTTEAAVNIPSENLNATPDIQVPVECRSSEARPVAVRR